MLEPDEDDVAIIDALIVAIRRLVSLARDGETLAGLGEVWASLGSIAERKGTSYANTLTLSIKRGSEGSSETLSAMVDISDEGIELSECRYVYSDDVGGDTEYTSYTKLDAGDGFDQYRFYDWMRLFETLEGAEGVKLEVERHHV